MVRRKMRLAAAERSIGVVLGQLQASEKSAQRLYREVLAAGHEANSPVAQHVRDLQGDLENVLQLLADTQSIASRYSRAEVVAISGLAVLAGQVLGGAADVKTLLQDSPSASEVADELCAAGQSVVEEATILLVPALNNAFDQSTGQPEDGLSVVDRGEGGDERSRERRTLGERDPNRHDPRRGPVQRVESETIDLRQSGDRIADLAAALTTVFRLRSTGDSANDWQRKSIRQAAELPEAERNDLWAELRAQNLFLPQAPSTDGTIVKHEPVEDLARRAVEEYLNGG